MVVGLFFARMDLYVLGNDLLNGETLIPFYRAL